jgi:PPP family 3-phenylpropionic acid transporter
VPARRAIKTYYFFFFAGMGATLPYLAPWFKEVAGASDRELGLLFMVRPAVGLLAQPLWGYLADATGKRSRLTAVLILLAALALPLVTFTPLFWPMVLIMALFAFFYRSIIPLGDSVTFAHLGQERRADYSALRVWGTVGFMITAASVGFLFDQLGLAWQFPVFTTVMLAAAWFVWRVPTTPARGRLKAGFSLRLLYTHRNIRFFMLAVLLNAMVSQMAFVFFGVYARSLGASNSALGWLWTVATGVEAALMPFIGRIMRRVGVKQMILLGLVAVALRWVPTAFLTSWWQLFPLQILHGITFCLVYVGAVTFMDMEARPEVRSSAQALYAAMVSGGRVLGGAISGEIAQHLGYRTLYITCGLLALAALSVVATLVREPHCAHDKPLPHTS